MSSGLDPLDDRARIAAIDTDGMLGQIEGLAGQLERGYAIARGTDGLPAGEGVREVVV